MPSKGTYHSYFSVCLSLTLTVILLLSLLTLLLIVVLFVHVYIRHSSLVVAHRRSLLIITSIAEPHVEIVRSSNKERHKK